MRVTVIASVRASSLEEAQAKLDAIAVSRAVRPPVDCVEDVSLQWSGTRSDRVEQCTAKQALRNARMHDFCEIIGDVNDDDDDTEEPNSTTLQ